MQYKKISEELLDDNSWWKYKKDVFEKPSGEKGEYFYAQTNGAAMVVAVREDGRIGLIRQYRYLTGQYSIEFPCGRIEPGEPSVDAAKRELLEETGCVGDDFMNIGVFEPTNGFVKDKTHVYVASIIEEKPVHDGDEDIGEVIFRRPDEISTMIRQNEITCGQTLAAWMLAQNYFSTPQSDEVAPGFKMISDYFLPGE